jgi:hypothetical protein
MTSLLALSLTQVAVWDAASATVVEGPVTIDLQAITGAAIVESFAPPHIHTAVARTFRKPHPINARTRKKK